MIIKPFEQASYKAQVLRLRKLAEVAITQYPIKVRAIKFIRYGENATFDVHSQNGKRFLLRIHRRDYHSSAAINEELQWLENISKTTNLIIPSPVRSKAGRLIEVVKAPGISNERQCCVFEWIEGRFIQKSIAPKHLMQLGSHISQLQNSTQKRKVFHRRYWDADGLLGKQAKFGSLDKLEGISAEQKNIVLEGRRVVYQKLKGFEKKHPTRMGLIHADAHFGNVLMVQDQLGIIDFDDCGFGFYNYDLAVPLISLEYVLQTKAEKKKYQVLQSALIEGYLKFKTWDRDDEALLPFMKSARRLTMLAWLQSRSDNPRLKAMIQKSADRVTLHLETELGIS